MKFGFGEMSARTIGLPRLPGDPGESRVFSGSSSGPAAPVGFDRRRSRMHAGTAMTTALTRIPSSRLRLMGASALILIVAILILPL
jgi:hypothetical protein